MSESIDVRKEYERWLDENYLAEFPRDPLHPNKVSYSWEAYKAGIKRGRELERVELIKQKPVGYLPEYELNRLSSGHEARLRSAKFGASALDGDVPLYAKPIPL